MPFDLFGRLWRRLGAGDPTPIDALIDPGFIAIDLETTGLDTRRDAVVAMAAIPFEGGRPRGGFVTLVNPRRPIPPASTAIHGIDDAAVAGAPPIGEALRVFDAECARRIVVGHDVGFDLAILARARGTAEVAATVLDTRRLARALGFKDTRLETVAERLHVPAIGRHSADGDARMSGGIMVALLPELRRVGVATIGQLLRAQRATPSHD
jgi:DNA polymerase III epsilon subunit-like protein